MARTCTTRGAAWAAILGLLLLRSAPGVRAQERFALDDVVAQAGQLAREPYRDRRVKVPQWMLVGSMSYDQWRDIRYRPERALWRDRNLPFQVQLFHPGLYYDRSVAVHVVDEQGVHLLPFSRELFDYGKNDFAERIPADVGYAGFRIHCPLKTPEYFDELVVFLGASYFRAVGRDQLYGLSARGLAIDTVEPSGEEFPIFTDFWLVTPQPGDRHVTVYALLDSPSATGAYRFDITPGEQTSIAVRLRLFPRRRVRKLGIAPLTSMFLFGEGSRRRFDDFRPEAHDSDGLLVHFASGEWLWRPLDNPPRIDTAIFRTRDPQGFGLLQRDRSFASYQDLETHSELRPSAWVVPEGKWGEGHVELVTIPSDSEFNDNVVSFWVPEERVEPGRPISFAYTLFWYGDDPARPPGGRAVATRQDGGTLKVEHARRFLIDFAGGKLASIGPDRPPRAVVSASGAEVLDEHVVHNPSIGGWRVVFQVKAKNAAAPLELRVYLERDGEVLTETWSYALLEK